MFTGIIEAQGDIVKIINEGKNVFFTIESKISHELKIDQSIAHEGVCLTVVALNENQHTVCAIDETLSKTNLSNWEIGRKINLERCMQMNGRLDGHIVQGHVDGILKCLSRTEADGSWIFKFELPKANAHLMVEKGSITINGTSLTCFNVSLNSFEVAIIPYTFEHTSIHQIDENDFVNVEYDILGKYVARMKEVANY